jgi:hypothetical protein
LGRIHRFIDSVIASTSLTNEPFIADQLFWTLEPNDYREKADFREALSDRVDRVLVYLSTDNRLVTWATPDILRSIGIPELDARERASVNLARVLKEATIETREIDGVQLGFIGTKLPFKAALILAPNLQQVVESVLGWPLLAIIPDRDFLYLWSAQRRDFAPRVGPVVVREYSKASYPISTEVFEIDGQRIRVIGEFPVSPKL